MGTLVHLHSTNPIWSLFIYLARFYALFFIFPHPRNEAVSSYHKGFEECIWEFHSLFRTSWFGTVLDRDMKVSFMTGF